MNALTLSRGLGWFSIALGAAELLGGRRLAASLGMEHRTPLFRLFGLREIAEKHGTPAHLIDGAEDIDPNWISDRQQIGVTAGASAPEILVETVIRQLREWGAEAVTEGSGKSEEVVFSLPKELQ